MAAPSRARTTPAIWRCAAARWWAARPSPCILATGWWSRPAWSHLFTATPGHTFTYLIFKQKRLKERGRHAASPLIAALRGRQSKFTASPIMIRTVASIFHGGRGSPSNSALAPKPNTGTSSDRGETVAAG